MAQRWAAATPEHFRFTAKFPQVVTHDTRLGGGHDALEQFFQAMKSLERKLLSLLIQLPPSLDKDEGMRKLERLVPLLWKKYSYAIEVRHRSWFDKEVYKFLAKHKICLAWSQLDQIQTPPKLTTDFLYLRFIGDRSIEEKDFGKIQEDRLAEMQYWARVVSAVKDKVTYIIVPANNHYAGFDPATANSFRNLIGMKQVAWDEIKQATLDNPLGNRL